MINNNKFTVTLWLIWLKVTAVHLDAKLSIHNQLSGQKSCGFTDFIFRQPTRSIIQIHGTWSSSIWISTTRTRWGPEMVTTLCCLQCQRVFCVCVFVICTMWRTKAAITNLKTVPGSTGTMLWKHSLLSAYTDGWKEPLRSGSSLIDIHWTVNTSSV